MNFGKYCKDKLYTAGIFLSVFILSMLLMYAFKAPGQLRIAEAFILFTGYLTAFFLDFFRKRGFYDELTRNMEALEEKYLILETMHAPGFYEGQIFWELLGEADRSMVENVKKHRLGMESFKEYVEMWIHEIKLPVASLTLLLHNYTESLHGREKSIQSAEGETDTATFVERINAGLRRINFYIEQILYYVRSENAEKDYIINDVKLSKIIGQVALKNKDDLLGNDISFEVTDADKIVLTDSKWMEFMLNQIISNSIKYRDSGKPESYIRLSAAENKTVTVLTIEDNGIGIDAADLPRVFEKSFTGENGREYSKATGMGLYIVKKLCDKMGHGICIQSVRGAYTKVELTFYKNDFYKELV